MKILFVCRANVGRSQMAAALYNHLTNTHNAKSAGTEVDNPGESLKERKLNRKSAGDVIDVMKTEGIDVSQSIRTQLTKNMLNDFDLIINMAQLESTPAWLSSFAHYTYWDVEDPAGKDYQAAMKAKNVIKAYILDLIAQ